jgi:hypothetical protein
MECAINVFLYVMLVLVNNSISVFLVWIKKINLFLRDNVD